MHHLIPCPNATSLRLCTTPPMVKARRCGKEEEGGRRREKEGDGGRRREKEKEAQPLST